ncbi:hypothetical protein [Arthrobacter sp. H-02-3]|uniref:hypothetical protein n=1 Tax=Arthrobacter sp. H-02-3 TaxID=2703675 RepID=UPI000DD2A253|nr:hypothetical protein [Arthrobacter sp. H-02-3]PVZ60952.1 hypothetical protein C9424_00735 [Arthrobacter sp. H-02-3]
MVDHPGITIDDVKIRRVNTDALLTQGFLCKPDGGSSQPTADDIDGAIAGVRMPEHPDQRFHAVEVSKGTAIYVYPVMAPKHAVEIADMIADAIAPLGFTGTITACADRPGPRPRTDRYAYCAAICSVDAALDNNETPLAFRSVKKNLDRWAVDSPVFKEIVERIAGWAAANATAPILAGLHFTMTQCEPHQVAGLLTRCCEDIGRAYLLFPTANGDWYVRFTGEGWILAGTEIKKGKDDAGEALTRLLADLAPLYDYAQMSRVIFGLVTPRSVMIQMAARGQKVPDTYIRRSHTILVPGPGDIELSADHGFVRNSIPGIFAVQVLGPAHPDLQPADRWRVTPLNAGRRMATVDNLGDWWAAPHQTPPEDLQLRREANKALLSKWA